MRAVTILLIVYNFINFIFGMIIAHKYGKKDRDERRKTRIIVSQALTCALILFGILRYESLWFLCFLCMDTAILIGSYFKLGKQKIGK